MLQLDSSSLFAMLSNELSRKKIFYLFCFFTLVVVLVLRMMVVENSLTFSKMANYQIEKTRKGTGELGYIFVTSYCDQMTGASVNVLSLQCWASTISSQVRTVEPFLVEGSNFGVTLAGPQDAGDINSVMLRDILDLRSWDEQANMRGYAPIVSWTEFLKQAPRDLILVTYSMKGMKYINQNYKSLLTFVEQNNFRIVRHVREMKESYSAEQFRTFVYGNLTPHHVVVLFGSWGGISGALDKSYRVSITDVKSCNRNQFASFLYHPSEHIKQDSQRYLEKYMPQAIRGGYISVMFRSERFALNHNFDKDTSSSDTKLSMFTLCVNGISKHVDKLKVRFGIESIFLTLDCRKQGSKYFRNPVHVGAENGLFDTVATMLYQKLYGNSSLEEWDESFDKITSFSTAGYVAQLQKYLAARGTCLLIAGGGSFQNSAKKLYLRTHKTDCTFTIPECQ